MELYRSAIIGKHQPALRPNGTSADLKEQIQSNVLKSWQETKVLIPQGKKVMEGNKMLTMVISGTAIFS